MNLRISVLTGISGVLLIGDALRRYLTEEVFAYATAEFVAGAALVYGAVQSCPYADTTRPRSMSQNGMVRTNSRKNLGELRNEDRNMAAVKTATSPKKECKDFCVVAIFSREASENFAKAYRSKMEAGSAQNRVTDSSWKKAGSFASEDAMNRMHTTVVGTDFQDQLQALLKSKMVPHLIAVIEGKLAPANLSLEFIISGQIIDIHYEKIISIWGKNKNKIPDHKQNFFCYVRADLVSAYTCSELEIGHDAIKFTALGIDYKTTDGIKYRELIVHVPNDLAKEKAVVDTVKACEEYAKNEIKNSVIVTSIVGDTNFKYPISTYTVPSSGGDGNVNPQSSGSQSETNFMQAIPLRSDHSEHVVSQPSLLNYVFIDGDNINKEATDHPSIMHYTAHTSEIEGRDRTKLPKYYTKLGV